ncbi:MAG: uncharacterized protein HW409_345 [candidate division NC10 bacterium]|nr:uncharacterized protein [candidate division NC10 bacterium]
MTVPARMREWLDQQKVKYEVLPHMEAYTAQEVAGAAHVPGRTYARPLTSPGGPMRRLSC